MTKVKFYNEPGSGVMAVFPTEYHDINNIYLTCYAHLGQHGSCHPDYLKECTIARQSEYEPLKTELESIGYKLKILNK